jgi:Aspartyl protease
MRLLLLTFLIVLLNSAAFSKTEAKNEIPFEVLESGHILVKATIDGVEGHFIFDTGAGITVFTKAFFSKLTHTAESGSYTAFRATGERVDLNLFRVKDVQFGNFKKAEEEVSWIDFNLGGIDGIISLKLLESQPFTIDFKKKVISLESKQTLNTIKKVARQMPIQLEQSRDKSLTIFSYFKINDTLTLQISMDSGAGKDIFRLNPKYLKLLNIDTSDTLRVKKITKQSEVDKKYISTIYLTKLNKLASANDTTINTLNFPVQFVEGLIYDGIIWINWLGSKITFDLQDKLLLIQR